MKMKKIISLAALALMALVETVAAAPPVPTLSSPYNGQQNVPQSTKFSYSSSGATYYWLVVGQNNFNGLKLVNGKYECPDGTCSATLTQATSYPKTLTLAGQKYVWAVRAYNSTGWSGWASRSFTTVASSLSSKVDAFVTKWTGTKVDFDNVYGAYAYQCVDLMHRYAQDVLGLDGYLATGNAYPIFVNTNSSKFTKILNTPSAIPQKGDIIFWKQSSTTTSPGHVSIFISGDTNTFTSFDQNWPIGSAPKKVIHHYVGSGELGGVVGWLHPNL